MKYDAVIFDLGNTLVSYYTRAQWPAIRAQAIEQVAAYLRSRGLLRADLGDLAAPTVAEERSESPDNRVVPLEERLVRIFQLSRQQVSDQGLAEMCRCFMKPIFALARVYDDVLPTLAELRRRGVPTGIVSNTPWGSPAQLWRE